MNSMKLFNHLVIVSFFVFSFLFGALVALTYFKRSICVDEKTIALEAKVEHADYAILHCLATCNPVCPSHADAGPN